MDIAEFEDLLDRLGDDISRWPVAQQRSASALLAGSSEARELLHEAQALRSLLSQSPVRAPMGLADRIVDQAVRHSSSDIQSESASLDIQSESASFLGQAWNIIQENFSFGRLAFLSVCFMAGLFGGVFHNMTSNSKPAFEANDFSAYLPTMPYRVD
jgi:hypothetical protein